MQLSVIIVNYNVRYFLEQCLHSLRKAGEGLQVEVIVMDNRSADGSLDYLQPLFPEVTFVVMPTNAGFAKACNQGLKYAGGRYILFLNPDTLLPEDCLHECLRFFEAHAGAGAGVGALGIKMVDGSGTFLRESRRSFPSPLTSLYKLSGLAWLFPRSPVFSRYYLGHLDENKNHKADVLAGAFMMIPREVLEITGGFDESFFMYGEDIDLSYRLRKAGYDNYYFAATSIIHFKGESTKTGSLNYVRMFYTAMSIFVRKHYGGTKAGFFRVFLHVAIWIKAFLSATAKFIRRIGLPIADGLLIFFSFRLGMKTGFVFIKPHPGYAQKRLPVAFIIYTSSYLAAAYYTDLYNKSFYRARLLCSVSVAAAVLLPVTAFMPGRYRLSAGTILSGSLLALALTGLLRRLAVKTGMLQKPVLKTSKPYLLIAATQSEFEEIKSFLQRKNLHEKIIGRIAVDEDMVNAVAALNDVNAVAPSLHAEELILCAGTLTYRRIISFIQTLTVSIRIRYHKAGSGSMVGSDSSTSGGETLSVEEELNLSQPPYRRMKRLVDVVTGGLLLVSFPLHFLWAEQPLRLIKNCFAVIAGRKTWVGYSVPHRHLPSLRKPVITVDKSVHNLSLQSRETASYRYARNYKPVQDIKLIIRNFKCLGG